MVLPESAEAHPDGDEDGQDARGAALQAPWRADAEVLAHREPQVEAAAGELQPWVCETTSHDRLSVHRLFDASRVDALVAAAYRPGSHYREVNKVLALVIFQKWYEMYLG